MKREQLMRILDANFNRSREGLRVCEEITRFVMNDVSGTKRLKSLRHGITQTMKESGIAPLELLKNRDTAKDVGKKSSKLELSKKNSSDLFLANIERVKEALRVLEEMSGLTHGATSEKFKKIRFQVYAVEKTIVPKLEAVHRNGVR